MAQRFCFEFCYSVGNLWSDSSFLFTAYTGSAASLFGGVTIVKHAHLSSKQPLTDDDIKEWEDVRILVIDEISFMKDFELKRLDMRLRELRRDRAKPFGGLSIIFAGDFRQLEPTKSEDSDLLFSSNSSRHFENCINAYIILSNNHRFKDDPEYGELLSRMWNGDLTKEDREKINTRVIGENGLTLPSSFGNKDVCYASPTNKERNAISAGNFKQLVIKTHPHVNENRLPPDHTIIIEADIKSSSSKRSKQKIDNVLRHRIITSCGDAQVKVGTKHIDPALCLYVGAYVICVTDNSHLKDRVPRGNGTLCRVSSLKLKEGSQRVWRNYYERKVWTICAKDVEYLELELANKPQRIVDQEQYIDKVKESIIEVARKIKSAKTDKKKKRKKEKTKLKLQRHLKEMETKLNNDLEGIRFKMTPENFSTKVSVKSHPRAPKKMEFACRMTQFPINLNDATTGHKLQGMSKDVLIITSWPKGGLSALFKNWEYVVLSRVRTIDGLYLFEPIDLEKSFKPSKEYQRFLALAKRREANLLAEIKKRKENLAKRHSDV